ncbi:MAG: acyltransferase [Sphingomonadales bacterium]|nr:acyltransferase [Sphingomonadales bacterium]
MPPARHSPEVQDSQGHINELDGVRAFSILAVMAGHLLPLGPSTLQLNQTSAVMGMSLFFGLSGFLITYFLWKRPDVPAFLIRRFARIVPLAYLYGAIVALVVFWRPDTFAAIVTFTLNYTDPQIFKGVSHLWSICVEMHFYLTIAAAVALFGRRGFWIVPIAAVIVTGLRVEAGAYVNIRTHLRVDEILSGALLGLYWVNRDRIGRPALEAALRRGLPLVALLWAASAHPMGGALNFARPYLAMLLIGGILFLPMNGFKRLLQTHPLAYIAKISYALYIWHPFTALGFMNSGSNVTRYLLKRPLSFAATFLLAHLSTQTLERYFIGLGKRLTGRRRA